MLDTCVLFPSTLCDTLLRIASTRTFRPLWSADIMTELHRSLVKKGLAADRADRRIGHMNRFFPDAMVSGYESLVGQMTNDPKDRHVLAAAVRAGAEVIVTFNLGDFRTTDLAPYDVEAVSPDDFLLDQLDLYPAVTIRALEAQAAAHRREPKTVPGILAALERCGLPGFAAEVRRHL
ncbi:PIN domain-containing protein [Symbioplanes lichenis]|uniref:PIN domain-containing protein n=1 Tax=Symbioplanes lichenis TaxID=1629072 RepID=UPI002738D20C|nr:PIN domain-containing protein [Actinoplanes lichenis]